MFEREEGYPMPQSFTVKPSVARADAMKRWAGIKIIFKIL